MGRSVPIFLRAAVIASACAMLLVCVRAAHAQSTNNDGYGLNPIPAPTTSVGRAPLAPAYPQGYTPPAAAPVAQGYTPAPGQSSPYQSSPYAPQANAGYGQSGYAPAPAQSLYPQNTQQPYQQQQQAYAQPYAQPAPYPAAPYYPPVQTAFAAQQAYATAPAQPYGYVKLPVQAAPQNHGYYPVAATSYGTQGMTDPNAYYAPSSNGQANVAAGYLLGSGDKVRVSVFGEDDLTGEYQIDGSGMVRMPLIGTQRAAGYTAPQLEAAIGGTLAQGYLKSPRVNVEIVTYRPFYIIGAVNRPGEYPYASNMSVLNAVAVGGGFTDKAKVSMVYVRHEGSTVEEALPASQMTRIWPGDVVRVKSTLFWDAMDIFTPLAPVGFAAAAIR